MSASAAGANAPAPGAGPKWAKVIDNTRCIGCHACTTACKSENDVPVSVTRTYVKYVDAGVFPLARRAFQVTRCNQCDDSPCTTSCPTTAMYRRADGIVDFDKSICIGCKACIASCPYDAIFINPEDHSAEKCNFCAHRIDMGLEPACVVVCPTEAILVGDLNDGSSKVAKIVNREVVAVRRPEKETHPKLFYKGASQMTLDPLAARRPDGGLFLWSQQGAQLGDWTGGRSLAGEAAALRPNSSAAALLSYDIPHTAPWDWKVSLYTWTKSIAAGAYLVPLLLFFLGFGSWGSPLMQWASPVLAGAFLAVTGALLIWDLEHPERFYLIFTRPQWKSWLVRGSFIIAGFSAVLLLHFIESVASRGGGGAGVTEGLFGAWSLQKTAAVLGVPLAVMTAVYTGYLFAQSKARDLWQSALLPPHLLVQALLAGSAALLPIASVTDRELVTPLLWTLSANCLAHLLLVVGEFTLTHPTAHAAQAAWEITDGRFSAYFWAGAVLVLVGATGPLFGMWGGESLSSIGVATTIPALLGLLCFEHAYVQGGQSVPLA